MSLPPYLVENTQRIKNSQNQVLAMWTQAYEPYRTEFPVVNDLFVRFPKRDIQRQEVLTLMKEDLYRGFVAAMMWGGINATRPATEGGRDTNFRKLLSHPRKDVVIALRFAQYKILEGDLVNLFVEFSIGGRFKLPGVGSSYFTKIFFFLGQLETDQEIKPLIWDKWTANAHCAMLIENGILPIPYPGISSSTYAVNFPVGANKARLYETFVTDFNGWAGELDVSPAKLEEFMFGISLRSNNQNSNPRLELWEKIMQYFRDQSITIITDHSEKGSSFDIEIVRNQHVNAALDVPELSSKARYFQLQEHFRKCKEGHQRKVTLRVDEICTIINRKLPNWAFDYVANYWGNGSYNDHVQKRAWLSQGYVVVECNIDSVKRTGSVVFGLQLA